MPGRTEERRRHPSDRPPRRVAGAICLIVGAAAALSACAPAVQAPEDTGVCWHMVVNGKGEVGGEVSGKYRFFVVKRNVADLEHCAAALDSMRTHFLVLGGSAHDVTGVYQGEFLFVDPRGVFSSNALDAPSFPMLTRTDDGRLVPQGSSPTPPS